MYLLDTNACIRILNGSDPAVVRHFMESGEGQIAISSVVRSELYYGARRSTRVAENLDLLNFFLAPLRSVAYDDCCADEYGKIRADLVREGASIGPADLMIAATAKARDYTLVTNNTREFSRVVGLRYVDWQQ